jgi:hypothetical protein
MRIVDTEGLDCDTLLAYRVDTPARHVSMPN